MTHYVGTDEKLGDYPVEVAVETTSSTWYNFSKMDYIAFTYALKRAVEDSTTFSMLNLDGVAIVVPWRVVRAVHVACMGENHSKAWEDKDDELTWSLVWERTSPATQAPARVFDEP